MNRDVRPGTPQTDLEPGDSLAALSRGLQHWLGIDISTYDESFLRKSFANRMLATGHQNLDAYINHLLAHHAEALAFHRSLQISYSEFFRNPLTFAILEQLLLPSLLAEHQHAARGELRIWSAGCSNGQEVWSIAMLLDEMTRADNPPRTYRIFASDLSETALAVARAGVYSADAMANTRWRHLRDCCERQGDSFVMAPRLRARVDFSIYDLLDKHSSSPQASIYGDFDLILCCNLLYYYRPAIQQQILDKLYGALAPGGYVVTGEAERDTVAARDGLRAVAPLAAVFQKLS